jgi:hypothetical protein
MATLDELKERYRVACHAIQTGVKLIMEVEAETKRGSSEPAHSPKHLRTGINSALVDSSAIASLLIFKGVITEFEYCTAIAEAMEEEVERYEKELSEFYGKPVHLA